MEEKEKESSSEKDSIDAKKNLQVVGENNSNPFNSNIKEYLGYADQYENSDEEIHESPQIVKNHHKAVEPSPQKY